MRLIDAEEFEKGLEKTLKWLKKEIKSKDYDTIDKILRKLIISEYKRILKKLKKTPSIDADPVVHAKWIKNIIDGIYVCSECEGAMECCTKYCPYCGAKMDKIKGDKNEI